MISTADSGLQNPEVPIFAEVPINQAINFMREHVSSDTPVFFSPFTLSHPVLAFRGSDLAPRRIGAFDGHHCMVIPDGSATYFSLTRYEPAFELDLSRWADLTVLHRAPLQSEGSALSPCSRQQLGQAFRTRAWVGLSLGMLSK